MAIPITLGTGAASVAAEAIGGLQYQQIEMVGAGGSSTLSIAPDGAAKVSVVGTITVTPSGAGSVIAVLQSSSIFAVPTGNQSVSGTVGASVIGNVNTTITSIATANGGLPIFAPLSARIQGTADLRVVLGASVAAIAAQGAGVRAYIDHVQVANFGSASVLVTIADNTTSILGYTIAPAGGGSNFDCFYRPAANSPITASINGTASVLVSLQGFTGP